MINNAVLVSGVQQSKSVIYESILFQILFPFTLLQSIEQSSLCHTVGPCWLSILNIAVCACQSKGAFLGRNAASCSEMVSGYGSNLSKNGNCGLTMVVCVTSR